MESGAQILSRKLIGLAWAFKLPSPFLPLHPASPSPSLSPRTMASEINPWNHLWHSDPLMRRSDVIHDLASAELIGKKEKKVMW